MSAAAIGTFRCPLCRSERARVTVSKANLCVVTCNGCHMQLFARSDFSDEAIRRDLVPLNAPPEQPGKAPAIDATPAGKEEPGGAVPEASQAPAAKAGWELW